VTGVNERAELDLLHPREGEMHDLSTGAFRFLSIFIAAAGVLMLAGVL
jgi:hypothetical protein